jgi:hypothetical protein
VNIEILFLKLLTKLVYLYIRKILFPGTKKTGKNLLKINKYLNDYYAMDSVLAVFAQKRAATEGSSYQ